MIAEWRKGCSCASHGRPEECQECTRGLIDAIEGRLRADTQSHELQIAYADVSRWKDIAHKLRARLDAAESKGE